MADHPDREIPTEEAGRRAESAGRLFDLRSVLAALFAVYGVVLVAMGLVSTSDTDMEKTGGMSINLWTGGAMLVAAALFGLWVWLRPLARSSRSGE